MVNSYEVREVVKDLVKILPYPKRLKVFIKIPNIFYRSLDLYYEVDGLLEPKKSDLENNPELVHTIKSVLAKIQYLYFMTYNEQLKKPFLEIDLDILSKDEFKILELKESESPDPKDHPNLQIRKC